MKALLFSSWSIAACAFSLSCATGSDEEAVSGQAGDSGGGQGGTSPASGGGLGVGGSGGAASCGAPLDLTGCPCTPGASPRECYPGPVGTLGIGACKGGQQVCTSSAGPEISANAWGPCSGFALPSAETCDGIDNDCDGTADQGCNDGGNCVPTTCSAQGKNCGAIPDGCGAMLDCGKCTVPATCGGSGKPGVCGSTTCAPTTCGAEGKSCGSIPDGCGGVLACGSCPPGQSCNSSNVCAPNPVSCPAVVASGQGNIIKLTVSGGALYWLDQNAPRAVKSAPLAGGPVTTLASGLPGPSSGLCGGAWVWNTDFAVDAQRAYWALNFQTTNTDPLALGMVALGGGTAKPIVPGVFSADSIATNGTHVVWTSWPGGLHVSVPATGSDKVITPIYGQALALDATHVYFYAYQEGIKRIAISGGSPTTLAAFTKESLTARTLKLWGSYVYWADNTGAVHSVRRVPAAGGAVQTLHTSPPSGTNLGWTLAVDDSNAYFNETSASGSLIRKVPVTGGATSTVTQSATDPWLMTPVAVGPDCVYWARRGCNGTTEVASAPK